MIGNIIKPYEDELLYSYLYRLAVVNGLDIKTFYSMVTYLPKKGEIKYQTIFDPAYLAKMLGPSVVDGSIDLLNKTSLLSYMPLFYNKNRVSNFVGCMYDLKGLKPLIRNKAFPMKELRACPECMEEKFYFRRIHQLPGMTYCPKHKVPLMIYTGRKYHEFEDNSYSRCKEDNEEMLYAQHIDVLSQIIEDFNIYDVVDNLDVKDASLTINNQHVPDKQFFFDLFRYVDKIPEAIFKCQKRKRELLDIVKESYELRSKYSDKYVKVKCKDCGLCFISTPERLESGWECPHKDYELDIEAKFRRLFKYKSEGKFSLVKGYVSPSEKIVYRCNACGRERARRPMEFLTYPNKCVCEREFDIEDERLKLKEIGFDLLDYDSKTCRGTFKGLDCGHTFTYKYHRFVKDPYCRICNPRDYTDESYQKKLDEIHNGKYTLISHFKGIKNEVTVRHCCGKEITNRADAFLGKYRCPKCEFKENTVITKEVLDRMSQYKDSDVIFTSDFSDYGSDTIKYALKNLTNRGLITRQIKGAYTKSSKKLTGEELVKAKYIKNKGEVFGFLVGKSFLYEIGAISEKPDTMIIVSNNSIQERFSNSVAFGTKIRIKKAPVHITHRNAGELQVLTLTASLRNSKIGFGSVKRELRKHCKKNGITEESLMKYIDIVTNKSATKEWVTNCIKELRV